MTTALRLFLSSAAFAIVIAGTYWLVAHEIIGTLLLSFMAFALCLIAGYMIIAEREADLWGDNPDANMADAQGSRLGKYTIRSALPFWMAVTVASMMIGLVISPTVAILDGIFTIALGAAFVAQST